MKEIHEFIKQLASTAACRDSVNQYAFDHAHNAIRRENLTRYLMQMIALKPRLMLIAEAPGYRGARLTGVPFTSRHIMQNGIVGIPLFGETNGYRLPPDAENTAWKEATATIVWDTINPLSPPPLNWNSYPFHPHLPGRPLTNRKPRKPEIQLGKVFLVKLMELFEIEQVVAVGNTAESTLKDMALECAKVRHPAQGGKQDFVAGMTEIMKRWG